MQRFLVLSDFDDTFFFRDDPEETRRSIQAVQAFRARGGLFGFVTGRGFRTLREDLPGFGSMVDYLIDLNGGYIYESAKRIYHSTISDKGIDAVSRTFDYWNLGPHRMGDAIVAMNGEKEISKVKYGISQLWYWSTAKKPIATMERELAMMNSVKVFAYYDIPLSHNFHYKHLSWVGADVRHLLEVIPGDGGKENAIAMLAKRLGPKVKIITAGDDICDLAMLKMWNGYAVRPKPSIVAKIPADRIVSSLSDVLSQIPL
ncbi:HAD family phosphatase [Candidatus Saccharibacteria bacterium]|nr:HAD family phosphatase [Candidatus Saccharibacteria bacterium]